ncbi:MAG: UDP-N-acetylmuramate--L-alanine ligase [Bacteroidetes bacterium]|nr:UDP-N-acetylmuramate--L-alanine ligase [Bacteroidota bacterium]MBS1757934.1 UDP-N-acetylmuramate--L-alanine ligase [Bacteroidota bacterium]
MKDLNKISSVYFLGIGGIGMSALARYFNSKGVKVSGYDKTVTALTTQLEAENIKIHYEDNVALMDKNADLVVYTPAIPASHTELNFYKDHQYALLKRSEVLGLITENNFNICVAGTHGKTTTSAMIAHILRDSDFGCNAFLGGIAANYNTNFWASNKQVCVAEADEFDRSFLKLSPNIAVITAMDADHLDIYGTEKNMQDAFIDFTKRIKESGLLIYKKGLKREREFEADKKMTYAALDNTADAFAYNLTILNGSYHFDVQMKDAVVKNVVLNMGGKHNIENAIAAIIVAKQLNIEEEKIIAAVASFKGVKRRFEYVLKTEDQIIIDDYAHHPEELRALIVSAKELFPGKKCTLVFQPHLYSRTKDLADGFAEVMDLADEIILLPIYPARELPVPGVSSELILKKMINKQVVIKQKEELTEWIKNNKTALIIIAGAGDIDTLVQPIKNAVIHN